MEQQALQLYSTLFNPEVPKNFEFFKVFYSTLVHANGLRSILAANLASNDANADTFVIELVNYGVNFYKDAIEYPHSVYKETEVSGVQDDLEEDDITNLRPVNTTNDDSSPSDSKETQTSKRQDFNQVVFKNIDEELRLQLILNILKIIRIVLNCVVSTNRTGDILLRQKSNTIIENEIDIHDNNDEGHDMGEPLTPRHEQPVVNTDSIEDEIFFTMTQWFLNKLVPSVDLPGMNQTSLMIIKEIIFLIYDYLMGVKSDGVGNLQSFNSKYKNYLELFVELLYKTHPTHTEEEVRPPLIRLSLESLIRIFYIVGTLNSTANHGFEYELTSSKYYSIKYQIIDILRYNLKYCHNYSKDMFHTQIMNESFFNWFTGNTLNFTNQYLNNKYISNISVAGNKELTEIFDNRQKEFNQLEFENFNILELLPINLYLYNLITHSNFVDLLLEDTRDKNELLNVWTCLLSYFLMYQYKSKQLLLNTRLILVILTKLIDHPKITELTINEFDFKLCRQRTPIIPLNQQNSTEKPLLSYFLDDLLVLIRYNINRKLNVENFINAIKLINLIIHKQVDDDYHYDELIKSCIRLLTFNHKHIKHQGLTNQILLLLNNGLLINSSVKFHVLYELLLNFDIINTIALTDPQIQNLFKGIEYCKDKFDLFNNDTNKINLLDSDVDSPELVDAINAFEPSLDEKGATLPTININVNELIVNF